MSIGRTDKLDEWQQQELTLYYQNDNWLYNTHLGRDWFNNFKKKIERGVFDEQKAIKGLIIFVDHVISKYRKEFGQRSLSAYSDTGSSEVNKATMEAIAKEALEDLMSAWELEKVLPKNRVSGSRKTFNKNRQRYIGSDTSISNSDIAMY